MTDGKVTDNGGDVHPLARGALIALAALMVASCGQPADYAAKHAPTVIGERGNCSVVRLWDEDNTQTIYVTDCGGGSATEWETSHYCGKACTRREKHRINTIPAESQ